MTRGVVVAPHRLAGEAGAQVLRDGGNAIDAAIAADAVLCVVYPHMTSIAGDLMALIWPAGAAAPVGLIGAGRSGALATIQLMRERGHDVMPARGALTVTVPGTVEAWGRLLERFGTVGLGAVLEPAAALARDGFVITPRLSDFLKRGADLLGREPAAFALYPPMEGGMLLRNPDLAAVLGDIASHGVNGFYRGEISRAIARALAKRDGLVTATDLAAHRSQWVDPIAVRYRETTIYELPPPTQGLTAAAMAVRLNEVPAAELQPGPRFVSHLRRTRDVSYRLRDSLISDPDFADVPTEPFTSTTPTGPPDATVAIEGGDTVYLCAADEHGNLVSMIQSVAFDFGSGIVAETTGMLLQNRGCYFSLDPAHINRLEPRKRTMHTLIPAMASRHGRPWAAYGSMGGDGQPQLQTQVLINLVDHALEPEEAVSRPRVRVLAGGSTVAVEADYPGAAELGRSDLQVQLMPSWHWELGHAHAILVDGPRAWRAAADPRSDGSAEFV